MKVNYKLLTYIFFAVSVISLLITVSVLAGNMDSPGAPADAASNSYTLEDIFNRLNAGAASSQSVWEEPADGPGSGTMYTLNDIMAAAPAVDDTNGAVAADVLNGKTFWSLNSGTWGSTTGTADEGSDVSGANGSKTFTIPDGFYAGKTATANDSQLVAENIASGVDIFGVVGTLTAGNTYYAGVPMTGQGDFKIGPRDDAHLRKGVAWANPRFVDNSDGTVTDNNSGLVWLMNANCAGTGTDWTTALTYANALYDGCTNCFGTSGDCGLSDGSLVEDWRLPNVLELQSLIMYGDYSPATIFKYYFFSHNIQSSPYWTSSTFVGVAPIINSWTVDFYSGIVDYAVMTNTYYVWPVRDLK